MTIEKEDIYKNPIQIAGSEERYVCPESLVLNPYQGCSFNCVYCYARWIMEAFGNWDIKPTRTSKINEVFKKVLLNKTSSRLTSLINMKIPFRFSNLTDPFQPIEKKEEQTYDILQYLKRFDYPVILNTKGVIQAEEKYLDLLEDMKVVVQETIISTDSEFLSKLEPNAPPPDARFEALNRLSSRDIPTQLRYSPVFPLLNDEPRELFKRAKEVGVNDIISEFIRIPFQENNKSLIDDALGYDYIKRLLREKYPIEKRDYWWKVKEDKLFSEYKRHKKIAKEEGLDYLICCEERPEINSWRNCCGVDKYDGFKGMDWTIQMRGKVIGEDSTTFSEYIRGTKCPYKDQFASYWREGKLEDSLTDLEFKNGTYKRLDHDRD